MSCTSTPPWAIPCAPSTKTQAPTALAFCVSSLIGFTVPKAFDWFSALDVNALHEHEQKLPAYATEQAEAFEGMRIIGTAPNKVGVLSFLLEGAHPADVGFILDRQGVAIRTGDNCAQPLMKRFGIPGTARASFSIYNTLEEVDSLFAALKKAKMMLA